MSNNGSQKWEETSSSAQKLLDDLISRLPGELGAEAFRIGYELQERCRSRGITYGTYDRAAELITIFLETIRENCADEGVDYERLLETTYLHELGHHLGLGEGELEKRGL